jgi:hypothetical protein
MPVLRSRNRGAQHFGVEQKPHYDAVSDLTEPVPTLNMDRYFKKTKSVFMYLWPTYYTLEIRVYIPTLPLFCAALQVLYVS